MLVFMFVLVLIVVMVMMALALGIVALFVIVMMMMVVVMLRFLSLLLFQQVSQFGLQRVAFFHRFQNGAAVELIPRSGDERRVGIERADNGDHFVQLVLTQAVRAGQHHRRGELDLIAVELREIFHIHFALGSVDDGGEGIQRHVFDARVLYGANDVAELAHAGRLDNDAVGVVLLLDLPQCLAEIAHQTAANAAGIHLGDLNAGLAQKAAVNANLAEFVLNDDQHLIMIGFLDELFNECGLAGSQKAGENIYLCHNNSLPPFLSN